MCNKSNTTGVICGAGTAYPPGIIYEVTPDCSGVRVARSLVFYLMFSISLFVLLSFFFHTLILYVLLQFTASNYTLVF